MAAPTPQCWWPRVAAASTKVFKAGGAQAVAAMAYGTATVPKVDKIFGPGTALTTAAKQIVATRPGGRGLRPAGRSFRSAGDR